jgi:hypothetical protein
MAGLKFNNSDNPQNIRVSTYITQDMANEVLERIGPSGNISEYLRSLIQKDVDKQEEQ